MKWKIQMKLTVFNCRTLLLLATLIAPLLALPSVGQAAPVCSEVLLQQSSVVISKALHDLMEVRFKTHARGAEKSRWDSATRKSYDKPQSQLIEELFTSFTTQDILKPRLNTETLSLEEKTKILEDYAAKTWDLFMNPKTLGKLRDQSLDTQLDLRGAPHFQKLKGRQRFAKVSRLNLERLWKKNDLSISKVRPEIEDLVDELEFSVSRNGRSTLSGEGLLSSRQLARFGSTGENSRHALNKEFLATDDNIYFHLFFRIDEPQSFNSASEYGDHGMSPERQAFYKEAVISPYIMWDIDMHSFAEKSLPELSGLSKEAEADGFSAYDRAIRSRLHEFDFTPGDLKTVMQAQLRKVLSSDNQSLRELQHLVENKKNISQFISEKVMEPLGLPDHLELKIPVYLPKADIAEEW
jgi:hypothetical protein